MVKDFDPNDVWKKIFPQVHYLHRWENGVCAGCGMKTQVKPMLDKKEHPSYFGNNGKGAMIRLCPNCQERFNGN